MVDTFHKDDLHSKGMVFKEYYLQEVHVFNTLARQEGNNAYVILITLFTRKYCFAIQPDKKIIMSCHVFLT